MSFCRFHGTIEFGSVLNGVLCNCKKQKRVFFFSWCWSMLVLSWAAVGAVWRPYFLWPLTSLLSSWHIETRCSKLHREEEVGSMISARISAPLQNIKLLVMHDIIMEFWEKYELIVVKKRPRSEKIFFSQHIALTPALLWIYVAQHDLTC
mgnify:CR=1 FL=1